MTLRCRRLCTAFAASAVAHANGLRQGSLAHRQISDNGSLAHAVSVSSSHPSRQYPECIGMELLGMGLFLGGDSWDSRLRTPAVSAPAVSAPAVSAPAAFAASHGHAAVRHGPRHGARLDAWRKDCKVQQGRIVRCNREGLFGATGKDCEVQQGRIVRCNREGL